MTKFQWTAILIAIFAVVGLYAATEKQFFGPPKKSNPAPVATTSPEELSSDTILFHAKQHLTPQQITRLIFLENSISRGDVKNQQLAIDKHLAGFWADSAKIFEPYAWYTGDAARLENSEKSLTFAAHLFLDNLM